MQDRRSATPIRVLVNDDTRVHTESLADALKRDGDLQVTTSRSGAASLNILYKPAEVDVLLLSSNLDECPGRGFEVLRGLKAYHPELRAVMLLDSSRSETVHAFRAGARGIFSKNDSVDILGTCLRQVHAGHIWANDEQICTLAEALASSHNIRAVDARGLNLLSKREMDVVCGVAHGLGNRDIAEQLQLSQHTVKNILFRIFDKLGVSSRVELLFMTLSQGRDAELPSPQFTIERAYESLRDEATMVACQNAAHNGSVMAQVALAQFYALQKTDPRSIKQAYVWYSVALQNIGTYHKETAKALSIDQILQAEQRASEALRQQPLLSSAAAKRAAPTLVLSEVDGRATVARSCARNSN
jgi:DNA-binding NarL/FixJ family response regulator